MTMVGNVWKQEKFSGLRNTKARPFSFDVVIDIASVTIRYKVGAEVSDP